MSYASFTRSELINTIPKRKYDEKILSIKESNDTDAIKRIKLIAVNRYYESNIPIEYWNLSMDDFKGSMVLYKEYSEYLSNLKNNYYEGKSLLFAGNHGLGKTMTCTSLLKEVVAKNYTGLYTNLFDIVNLMISSFGEDKIILTKELKMVDFLVIDEFDNRFIQSEKAADLYAQTLEIIFRCRMSNKLPTFMCTNSPNILEGFSGPLKESISSLISTVKVVPIIGKDHRKQ